MIREKGSFRNELLNFLSNSTWRCNIKYIKKIHSLTSSSYIRQHFVHILYKSIDCAYESFLADITGKIYNTGRKLSVKSVWRNHGNGPIKIYENFFIFLLFYLLCKAQREKIYAEQKLAKFSEKEQKTHLVDKITMKMWK